MVPNNKPTLFSRLDFEKAFGWVKHPYIWAVLEKWVRRHFLDVGERMRKGLLAIVVSKVHVNGQFT